MMNHARPIPTAQSRTGRLRAGLAVGALGALLAIPLAAQEEDAAAATGSDVRADSPQLSIRDHEKIAKGVAAYYEARAESEGVLDAREDLDKDIAKIAKKAEVDDLLALSADWEAALRMVKEYPSTPDAGKGSLDEVSFEGFFKDTINYQVRGPKSYRRGEPVPLLIIVPDAQQRLGEMLREDWIEEGTGIEDEFLIVATEMPTDLTRWTLMGDTGKPGGIDRILQVFKHVSQEWNVDTERVFLCGMEDGVGAVVRLAALYPDRFAGVVGIAGDPLEEDIRNFASLPLFLVAGADNATNLAREAEEREWSHIEMRPNADSQEIYRWLQGRTRNAHPQEVYYVPLEDFAKDAYWLRVIGADPEATPWVHAVADRATNTVTIEGTGIRQVVLFYTDRVLDLDRPVKVEIGGVKHEHRVQRNLEFLLDRARVSGDPGRAYVEQRPFDFPELATDGEGGDEASGE